MRPGGREGAGTDWPVLRLLGGYPQLLGGQSQLLTTYVNKLRCRAAGLQAQPPWQLISPASSSAWAPTRVHS